MNLKFYTILYDNKFMPSNFMRDLTDDITECIRFNNIKDAEEYYKLLSEDKKFKIAEVECKINIL